MTQYKTLAIDLGANSGRVMESYFDGEKISLKEIYRFVNSPVQANNSLYWDILKLFQEIKHGIKIASKEDDPIQSISVDTWGVDYAYLDKDGDIISFPHCYRDKRMDDVEEDFYQTITKKVFFMETGVQPSVINSVMQIYADINKKTYLKEIVDSVLFMPDLFNYLLTGKKTNEFTITSTSGLLNGETRNWSVRVFEDLDIPEKWFNPITATGTVIGPISKQIATDFQLKEFDVVAGTSHDTASAVLAIPYENKENSVFISCGTWSLVGCETEATILTEDVFKQGLTNEGCLGKTNRLLKNITGLWILQELKRNWSYQKEVISYPKMTELALNTRSDPSIINVNDTIFSSPGNMVKRIQEYCSKTNQAIPENQGKLVNTVLNSLALSYRETIESIEKVTNKTMKTIHMIGGGIQNHLLCQLTANICNKKVVAGPIEASAAGNILSQLYAKDKIHNQSEFTHIIKNSFDTNVYEPNFSLKYEKMYQNYLDMKTHYK